MKLSLFSVSYAGYWGQQKLDTVAFIAKAAQLGYDAVMLAGKRPHLSPLDADADTIASIKAALAEHGVACGVIAGYTDLSPAAAAEVPYLEMQIAYVDALARIGKELGATVVRVFTAYESDAESPHAAWQRAVTCLQEVCDRLSDLKMTAAVQNHHDVAVDSDALLEFLYDVDRPNCRAGFDAWSPALRGENLYEAARKMAPYTAITTNADYVRFPRYRYQPDVINYRPATPDLVRAVKFGDGFIDYPAFFAGLKEGGFNGLANYEMCSPIRGGGSLENLNTFATGYVQWMRDNVL
ncbi:MAG: sugar phosphate isomerase/epimerase [Planctomycetes bacterium]|nr:sugar phosphate isomerase/epimerase [Planctomycetota bacterium]